MLLQLILLQVSLGYPEDLEATERRRGGGNRRRPCVFRTKIKKGHHNGRTLFDWNFQHYDVSYNYNYNIDCNGGGGGNYGNYPLQTQGGGHHGNHGGGHNNNYGGGQNNNYGGGHNNNNGGLLASHFNRPQFGPINNIPGIPQIGQSQSQTQAVSDESGTSSGFLNPNRPILSGVGALIGNIPNNPVAQGIGSIGEGIGSILQIIPQTLQNFQSSSSGFFNFFNRPASTGPVQNVPQVTTPVDPDDVIYNDETATPVNANHDPVYPNAYHASGRPPSRPGLNSYYNRLPFYSPYRGY